MKWSVVLGWRKVEEDGKEVKIPVSANVFPPTVAIDVALLPPASESQGGAMKAIQTNQAIPPAHKMKYITAWSKMKQTGQPPQSEEAPTMDMSLKDILRMMEKKGNAAIQDGSIMSKMGANISGLDGRSFWIIPADQTPSCVTVLEDPAAEGLDVRHLAAIRIPLTS